MKHFRFILPLIFILSSCSNDSDDRIQSTQLELTILDELNVAIQDVEVKLYASQTDYDNDTNVVTTLSTDVNGKVTFDNLQPLTYYWRTNKSCYIENSDYNSISPITSNTFNQISVNINSNFIGDLFIINNSLYNYSIQYTGPDSGSIYSTPGIDIYITDKPSGVYTFTFEAIGTPSPVTFQMNVIINCGETANVEIN